MVGAGRGPRTPPRFAFQWAGAGLDSTEARCRGQWDICIGQAARDTRRLVGAGKFSPTMGVGTYGSLPFPGAVVALVAPGEQIACDNGSQRRPGATPGLAERDDGCASDLTSLAGASSPPHCTRGLRPRDE